MLSGDVAKLKTRLICERVSIESPGVNYQVGVLTVLLFGHSFLFLLFDLQLVPACVRMSSANRTDCPFNLYDHSTVRLSCLLKLTLQVETARDLSLLSVNFESPVLLTHFEKQPVK